MTKKKKSKKVFPASRELIDLNLEENHDVAGALYNTKYGKFCEMENKKCKIVELVDNPYKNVTYLCRNFLSIVITMPVSWRMLLDNQDIDSCFKIYKLKKTKKSCPYHIIYKDKLIGGFNKDTLFEFLRVCNYYSIEDIEKLDIIKNDVHNDAKKCICIDDIPSVYDMSKHIIDSLYNINIYATIQTGLYLHNKYHFQSIYIYGKRPVLLMIPPNNVNYEGKELFYKNKLVKHYHILRLSFYMTKSMEVLCREVVCSIHYLDVIEMIKIIISSNIKTVKSIFKKCINTKFIDDMHTLPFITLDDHIEKLNEDDSILPIPNKIKKRQSSDRFLKGKLNVKIIYPSGKVYSGRIMAESHGLIIFEPALKGRSAWLCNFKDIEDLKVIDLNTIKAEKVYHTDKNIEWLKSLKLEYINDNEL